MSYTLNNVDLSTYGIIPGHGPGSNIAMAGCFDLPERLGETYHDWGDENGIEPYVTVDEIFFTGRTINLYGSIIADSVLLNTRLQAFYSAIEAFTDLVELVTPYGTFTVMVVSVTPEPTPAGCSLVISFREPVCDTPFDHTGILTDHAGNVITDTLGNRILVTNKIVLPSTGSSPNTIDGIPISSLGLNISSPDEFLKLLEYKDIAITEYGKEGYRISKRKGNYLEIRGFVMANSLPQFITYVRYLYTLFSNSGTRQIKLRDEVQVECFAAEGFKIKNLYLFDTKMIGSIDLKLLIANITYL